MPVNREDVVTAVSELLQRLETPLPKAEMIAEEVADQLELGVPKLRGPVKKPFYDLRREQDFVYPGGKRKVKLRGGKPAMRKPERINGIVVHQTACVFGVSKRLLKRSGGNADLAVARRGLEVACHALAFRRGFFMASHDLALHVNHANGLNSRTLGLEIEGFYPGLEKERRKARGSDRKLTKLNEQTIETGRAALRWLVEEGRAAGMPIRYLYAHRQSSPTRRADPGEELWRAIAPWAVENLELELRHDQTLATKKGDGRPVPKAWDSDGVGRY